MYISNTGQAGLIVQCMFLSSCKYINATVNLNSKSRSLKPAFQNFAQGIFVLPDTYPVTALNLNYCPIAIGLALLVLLGAWFLPKWGVGRWYRGKAHTLKDADVVMPPLEAVSTSVFCSGFWLEATVATNVCLSNRDKYQHMIASFFLPVPGLSGSLKVSCVQLLSSPCC